MQNPSFEDGWDTLPSGNQEPHYWTLQLWVDGSQLHAPKAGDGDTRQVAECYPECVHKPSRLLPADEQLGGDDALILDGEHVYKIFGNSSFRATLTQTWDEWQHCCAVAGPRPH